MIFLLRKLHLPKLEMITDQLKKDRDKVLQ